MATSPLRLQQGYGIGNALQPIPPFSIIANRAPTQQDKARIGTFWVYTALNNVYVLTSVTGGVSNWLTLSNGGAGVFLSLTVNGPSTFAGNITQIAGVTSLLTTTTAGFANNGLFTNNGNLSNNGLFTNNGNFALNGYLGINENVNDTVIYTNSSRLNGSRHLLCTQTSADEFPVFWTTVKSRAGAVVNPNDLLFQLICVAQGNTAQTESAKITVVAGTPIPGNPEVPSRIDFGTTNNAGVFADRFSISPEGQINILTAGQTLGVTGGGATPFIGNDTLAGGTVAVANASIAANDKVFVTVTSPVNPGFLSVVVNAGVGFTVNSSNAGDTSVFDYFIVRQI